MFSPLINFKLFLGLSFFFALSSTSSMMLWIALEINMLSFLPLMSFKGFKMLENTMKYFLIQSLSSALFLLSTLLSIFLVNSIFFFISLTAMLMKLGAAPFHMWFISLLKSINMWILFFLCTFQKIIPLIIIFSNYKSLLILSMSIIMNSFMVFWNSFILFSLNNILAFSSINNLSWMLLGLAESLRITMYFFFIYTFLLFSILILYWNPSINFPTQIQSFDYKNSLLIVLVMMSLGGMPPLLGFLGKVMILKQVFLLFYFYFILILIFSSLMILFLYINYSFFSILFIPSMMVLMSKKSFSFLKSFFSVSLLSFTVLVYFYI